MSFRADSKAGNPNHERIRNLTTDQRKALMAKDHLSGRV